MNLLINIILINLLNLLNVNHSLPDNYVKLSLVSETIKKPAYSWGGKYVELKSITGEVIGHETYKKFYYLKQQKKYFTQTEIIWLSGDTLKFGPYGETFVSSDLNTIVKYGYFKGDSLNSFDIFFYNREGTELNKIEKYFKKQPDIYMAKNGYVGAFGKIISDDKLYSEAISIYNNSGETVYQNKFDTLFDIRKFRISENLKMYAYDFEQFDYSGKLFSKGLKIREIPDNTVLDLELNYLTEIEYFQFFKDDYFILKTSELLALYSFPANQLWSHYELYQNAERFAIIENKNICIIICPERLSLSQWDTNYTIYVLDLNSGAELTSYLLENKGPIFETDEVIKIIDDYNFDLTIHNETFSFNISY